MESKEPMKSPFPWFGGKSRVAHLVWDRFGNVPNYVEPFFGSGAVLLERPWPAETESVNDLDCMVANFWRALQRDPDAVAKHADNPVNEADQHARHLWLCSQEDFRERMKMEPDFYDAKIAGWWVWGQCIWIGAGWCSVRLPHLGDAGKRLSRNLPDLGNAGRGVHRKLPHLGTAGTGVQESDLTSGTLSRGQILVYMRALAERLRRVRVCCGDWSRLCGPSVTVKHGITGVFLDPPYSDEAGRTACLYASDSGSVAHAVASWAFEWGEHPDMRIALCGYEGEHSAPGSWECVKWKALGGYGSQGNGTGRENSGRERIWFSPHCLKPKQGLFSDLMGLAMRDADEAAESYLTEHADALQKPSKVSSV
jgi:D12 class N6 adenine-specific DNA methyltransferase